MPLKFVFLTQLVLNCLFYSNAVESGFIKDRKVYMKNICKENNLLADGTSNVTKCLQIISSLKEISHGRQPRNDNEEIVAFEGDILLTGKQAQQILVKENETFFNKTAKRKKRKTLSTWIKWPTTIHYAFHDDCTDKLIKSVNKAADNFNEQTCLHFIEGEPSPLKQYVLIRHTWKGCQSHYGLVTVSNYSQDLYLGGGCEHWGIVSHEMSHTLGIMHEQNRNDRNLHIMVHYDNIIDGLDYAFEHCGTKWPNSQCIANVPYDLGSIMHYGKEVFSKGGRTITTKNPNFINTIGGKITGPSFYDIKQLNFLYCNLKDPCDQLPPNNNIKLNYGSFCLVLNLVKQTREHAAASCTAFGPNGRLIQTQDTDMLSAIYTNWKEHKIETELLWTGLRTFTGKSQWYWTPDHTVANDIKWAKGEPNFPKYLKEQCAVLIMKNERIGTMADVDCNRQHYYICQYDMTKRGCTKCKNGGYPHPKNCSKCLCPLGFAGIHCETFKAGTPKPCGGWLTASSNWSRISSPKFPSNMNSEQRCSWILETDLNKKIEFKFDHDGRYLFQPSSGVGCFWNYVEVKYSYDLANSGARFCGRKPPTGTFRSKTNRMIILLMSEQFPARGFSAQFRSVYYKS